MPKKLAARLPEVLSAVYLLFNEAYLSSTGEQAQSRDLAEDAEFLAEMLSTLMPNEPEVLGLLALIRPHRARFTDTGAIVQLPDQDRALCPKWIALRKALPAITCGMPPAPDFCVTWAHARGAGGRPASAGADNESG
jgi:predicted RNA polymerase sigma factor